VPGTKVNGKLFGFRRYDATKRDMITYLGFQRITYTGVYVTAEVS